MSLVIAGCGSSKSNVDGAVANDAGADVHADTAGGSDVKDTAPDHTPDAMVDHGSLDVARDIVDSSGSICLGPGTAPTKALITDFGNGDNAAFGTFGQDPVTGNTYAVDINDIQEDFSNNNWHITGFVRGQQDFFGLSWTCASAPKGGCTLDASQYAGIQFTIMGYVGPSRTITFTMGRAQNDTAGENAMCGTCVAPADAASREDACHGPRYVVTLPANRGTPVTVQLHWADLTGGSPFASIDPHQITGILWYFTNPPSTDGGATDAGASDAGATDAGATDGSTDGPLAPPGTYAADVTLDDIKFISF